ncbi:hypothetical protein L2D14_06610 [Thalassospiraceae bacterium LMO-JJ14]|nr:hypothetical protein L2D14_06610 [Thalassospiraceae bacterium LMO-JJ14]
MKKTPIGIVSTLCALGLVGGIVSLDATSLQAGPTRDTATISVTIQAAASLGVTRVTPVTTAKSGGIPSIPVSTTSNVGYDSSASTTADAGTAASTGTSATPDQAARTFAANGASPISIGPSAAVAVAGAPNQTFNVILPGKTSFASGGNVVKLSGFQHSAGATPALGSDGSGTFSIGAAVDTAPVAAGVAAGAGGGIGNGQQTVLAAAFTQSSPFVNIVVSYN